MLEKFPLDKINGTKKGPLFSQAPTIHSFTFNLELKHQVRLSKTIMRDFHFRFRLIFKKFIFLFNKMYGLYDFKTS